MKNINLVHNVDMRYIGVNIRRCRRIKGISQTKLAESIGVTWHYVQKIESGKSTPSIKLLDKIAKYFGMDIHTFFMEYPDYLNDV